MTLTPTDLEEAAIQLHDFLWQVLDEDEAGAYFAAGEADCDKVIFLLNDLQEEILARGLESWNYARTRDDK